MRPLVDAAKNLEAGAINQQEASTAKNSSDKACVDYLVYFATSRYETTFSDHVRVTVIPNRI